MRLAKNWKKRLLRSYSSWTILANILVALSVSGLTVVGVIASEVALPTILCIAIPLGIIGLIGRILDQGLDDIRDECNGDNKDV